MRDYPDVHFDISHSQYVAGAVGDQPVGIDVQVVGACRPDVAVRVRGEEELARIGASDAQLLNLQDCVSGKRYT